MELPHELQVGVHIMRIEVEGALERLEIDPKHAEPAVIFRHACEVAHNHYMIQGEEMQFRCAIGVLIVTLVHHGRTAENDKVTEELRGLNSIGAAMQGVPVDFSQIFTDESLGHDWVGLVRIWQEVKRDAAA